MNLHGTASSMLHFDGIVAQQHIPVESVKSCLSDVLIVALMEAVKSTSNSSVTALTP